MESAAYWLAGMRLQSEIPLPGLPLLESSPPGTGVIRIRRGPVAFELSGGVEIDPECLATSTVFVLQIPGVARYRVSDGREIVVDAAEDAMPMNVRAYLLGSVLSVLWHQRGLLPLHGSAVQYAGGAAAFLGNSGDGKSSLAAQLAERGHAVVADDVCLVNTAGSGRAEVIPSAPWLKLWRASLDQLGRGAEGLEQVCSEEDKYHLPLGKAALPQNGPHVPLSVVMFLERSRMGEPERARVIEAPHLLAVTRLMSLTHEAFMVEALGMREENFRRCGRALSQSKAYRLVRPWGFEHMGETVELVEKVLGAY